MALFMREDVISILPIHTMSRIRLEAFSGTSKRPFLENSKNVHKVVSGITRAISKHKYKPFYCGN